MVPKRREQLYSVFCGWAEGEFSCSFSQLCCSGLLLGTTLVAFGKFLFYQGSPKYMFSETINACADRFKHYRAFFSTAWSVLTRWEEEEPSERSMIMPVSVFKAALVLSLLWGWPYFAAALMVAFNGLLRPCEFLTLKRRNLLLPRDLLSDLPVAYVRLLNTKTKRFMLHQHAKISDSLTIQFLDALFGDWLHGTTLQLLALRVQAALGCGIFQALGVRTDESSDGVTPKCLRGSGATWLYQVTENISSIQWRGRWQKRRTLEYYLQDVTGQLLLADLAESHRQRIWLRLQAH